LLELNGVAQGRYKPIKEKLLLGHCNQQHPQGFIIGLYPCWIELSQLIRITCPLRSISDFFSFFMA
jgi:hypothetical protein